MPTKLDIARDELRRKGLTIKEWAKRNGYPERSVRAVLSGHNKGYYGQAHKIAVDLGLKEAAQ
ncbi:helix-turn-helix domain-containing protein [Anianabacter salinae]|uniref:hypothetical protein n=1 Tax=Anianabacter salinae TaxID=2851023 RepID=UPI00389942BB|nr:DNA-binding protein [Anianabacter salinae]